MWKSLVAGTTALMIAGTSSAFAQPAAKKDMHLPAMTRAQPWRPNAGDIMAFANARIAALHAGLALSPAQQKHWRPVAAAMRNLARQRAEWVAARAYANKPKTPVDRLALLAQTMEKRGAALRKIAETARPLYNSLTPDQKHRFIVLTHLGRIMAFWRGRPGWHRPGRWHGQRGGQPWQHRRG